MKVSLQWLQEYVDLPGNVSELTELLTLAGVEVEGIETLGADIPKVVVAQILESEQHPNADRLSVCKVDDGSGIPRQIVCGAKNYKVGDKVPVALPGAVLPGDFKIKVGKLRGVESEGMLCSSTELGLPKGEDGLLILPGGAKVGASLSDIFPSDTILDLEITPNRPDLLSYIGIAREVAALTKKTLRLPAISWSFDGKVAGGIAVEAADCSLYTVQSISNVTVGASPEWLSRKLEAAGLRSINVIVDVTNFVMLETGQPLHAFDADKLDGEINVRAAREGEAFLALDGRTYKLGADNVVIADANRILALGGVMGGEDSGVTNQTKNILLESAEFTASNIRRTSRTLGLSSDSSYRFERGVDFAGILNASSRAAALISELSGGSFVGVKAGFSNPSRGIDFTKCDESKAEVAYVRSVPLRGERVAALLGTEISDEKIEDILSGFGLIKRESGWQIPSFRQDLTREVDLIEEIARVVGIQNIPARLSSAPARPGAADAAYDFIMGVRQKLAALGFSEARTSTLVSEASLSSKESAIRLKNPLGEDQAYLRASLTSGLLGGLSHNIRQGAKSVALFEVGKTFRQGASEETTSVGILLYGENQAKDWRGGETRSFDWYDAKGVLAALGDLTFRQREASSLFALAAVIHAGSEAVGFLGQLAPSASRTIGAAGPVFVGELDLDILGGPRKTENFAPIPKFPSTVRDIAVVAAIELPYEDLEKTLRAANEELLVSIAPVSIFTDPSGEKLPADRKSLAISLTFRAADRTLNTEEVNAACERLKKRLKDELAVNFRE